MQDYITKQSLTALGIQLNDADADSLIAHFNEVVEEMIGDEIIDTLTDDQVEELVTLQKTASDDEIGTWIADHVPDYEQIVSDNIDIAIADMVEASEGISDVSKE
ncbi:MAG: hypothetical protein JWN75_468 [Candidatus Saccharibacteria bacterium]|nr:hypothetical protein [Candidatus Saccharibacteria bacterium]